MQRLFLVLGQLVFRFRLALIAGWLALVLAGGLFAPRVHEVFREEISGAPQRDASRAKQLMESQFRSSLGKSLVLVLGSPALTVDDPAYREALQRLTLAMLGSPYVARVFNHANSGEPSMVSKDRHFTYCLVTLGDVPDRQIVAHAVPGIRAVVRKVPLPPGMTADLTGSEAVLADFLDAAVEDQQHIEKLADPLAAIFLVLVFGGLVGALTMLVMGLFTVTLATAALYFVGLYVSDGVPTFSLALLTLLGLSTGIDYSLIVVMRFREELEAGRSPREAVELTVATAGRTVAFAGSLIVTSLLFLVIPNLRFVRLSATGAIIVVALAVLVAITFLPPVLYYIHRWLDFPGFLANWLRRWPMEPFWLWWHRKVTARPLLTLAIGLPLFAALIWPFGAMQVWEAGVTVAPKKLESTRGYENLKKILSAGELEPIFILVRVPAGEKLWRPQTIQGLYKLSRALRRHPLVASVESIVDLDPSYTLKDYEKLYLGRDDPMQGITGQLIGTMVNGQHGSDLTLLKVTTREASSVTARQFIYELRDGILPGSPGLAGTVRLVGGHQATMIDLDHELFEPIPWLLAAYIVVSYFLLLLLFRSVFLPVKALFINALPVLASFGILTLVMQYGWGASWLGVEQPGAVLSTTPTLLFAVLFGLSMDYEVLMLMRVKEEYEKGLDNREAVIQGLSHSAKIITGGALIMLSIFLPFVVSPMVSSKELGIGMSAGIFLDATLGRLFLVPCFMVLMGSLNWWFPGRNERV